MYTNIIVGVDGRQGGRDAASLGGLLASSDASRDLVFVTDARINRAPGLTLEFAADEDLHELLAVERRLCGGDPHIRRTPAPSVGAGLNDVAAAAGADLVVVGASRRHGITSLFSADDVRSVLHRTPCAVAVAPAEYACSSRPLRRIGAAFDGSAPSEVAVAHAGLLADEQGAALVVRHVVEPAYDHYGVWAAAAVPTADPESELAGAQARLREVDGLEIEHLYGPMRESTNRLAADLDLLVCGSRRYGTVHRLAVGSTSQQLARHVDIPLVIAPAVDSVAVDRWRELRNKRRSVRQVSP